jgi:hypothetical protein
VCVCVCVCERERDKMAEKLEIGRSIFRYHMVDNFLFQSLTILRSEESEKERNPQNKTITAVIFGVSM